jgi:D-alanyl-D-alanine dipeptidase
MEAILERKKANFEHFGSLGGASDTAQMGPVERQMRAAGLIRVRDLDPRIRVELAYATPDNFLDSAVYGELRSAYLRLEAVAMLSLAQDALEQRKPGYRLLVYDAARPRSVQESMWALVQGTPEQRYVADPAVGSLHGYGAAVDLTLADSTGRALDMGTPFDHFGPLAQPRYEARYRRQGQLSTEQIENRRLLREVMQSAGFQGIPSEWWHFNAFGLEEVKRHFALIE